MHRPPQGKVEIGTSCLIHLSTDVIFQAVDSHMDQNNVFKIQNDGFEGR